MQYKSSVTIFVKALLCDIGKHMGLEIRQIDRQMKDDGLGFRQALEELLAAGETSFLKSARVAIPDHDWDEIIDYICRYHAAYGYQSVAIAGGGRIYLFLPWVASIAVCAIDDIGR